MKVGSLPLALWVRFLGRCPALPCAWHTDAHMRPNTTWLVWKQVKLFRGGRREKKKKKGKNPVFRPVVMETNYKSN